jgi:hypothetical protein
MCELIQPSLANFKKHNEINNIDKFILSCSSSEGSILINVLNCDGVVDSSFRVPGKFQLLDYVLSLYPHHDFSCGTVNQPKAKTVLKIKIFDRTVVKKTFIGFYE